MKEKNADSSQPCEREILYQTDSFEIVSIDWSEKSISPSHNHGWSECFVLIQEGVFENEMDLGAKKETRMLEAGQVLATPVGARHEMRCKSPKGKTLHVYTPKIQAWADERRFRFVQPETIREAIALSEPTQVDVLQDLLRSFREQSVSTRSPYFMNQLFAGILPQMLMAEELISQTKTTLATFEASPVFSAIETEVVKALSDAIGWPPERRTGVCVPGGSSANFMALHCARQNLFPEIKKKGVVGQSFKVFVSKEAHYSFKKACAVLGIGTDHLVAVPADSRGRIKPEELDRLISNAKKEGAIPLLVSATAGTTVLGAFDDLLALSEISAKHGVWLHVDAAWGGPALFSKKLRHLMRGIELADSVTFDAHKLLGASITSSFFLSRHNRILLDANDVTGGDYLFHSDDPALDLGKMSWQCGRRADAVSFWAIWKSLGTDGIGRFVDRLLSIRDETLQFIQSQSRLELISPPDYLNICVRIVPPYGAPDPDWSRVVRERMKSEDKAFVNYSSNQDGSFLRLILAHPYLEFSHVRQILKWALEVQAVG
jgi:glutamate/tyrosine decarboxylase-like PLP-dependent enzyme/quercetin dioxygenase-like cupin family protein